MLTFLVDSNVLSEPVAEQPDRKVLEKLLRYEGRIATASVVWHELRFGAARLPQSRRRKKVDTYLREVAAELRFLPYDRDAAEWHAEERARLQGEGIFLAPADGQIAAVAHVNGLILVTRNIRDFRGLRDLEVVSWHSG